MIKGMDWGPQSGEPQNCSRNMTGILLGACIPTKTPPATAAKVDIGPGSPRAMWPTPQDVAAVKLSGLFYRSLLMPIWLFRGLFLGVFTFWILMYWGLYQGPYFLETPI